MKFPFFILVTLSLSLLFAGCDKNRLANDLEGYWTVTSWKYNGTEYMVDYIFTAAELKFQEYNFDEELGEMGAYFTATSSNSAQEGTYSVNQETSEVTIDYDGTINVYQITLDDDRLTLSNDMEVIIADRK